MSTLSRLLSGAAWFALAISPAMAADRGVLAQSTPRVIPTPISRFQVATTTSGGKELVVNASRAYPASCFSDITPQTVNSLPTGPGATDPIWGGTVTLYAVNKKGTSGQTYTEDVTITIFRVPCSSSGDKLAYNPDGGPVSATLIRIQRQALYDHTTDYYPTFPAIRIAQGSIAFDNANLTDYVRVASEPNTVVSDTQIDSAVTDSATFVLENYPYQSAGFFDFNNAFSIRFDNCIYTYAQNCRGTGQGQVTFNIPAYNPTQATYPAAFQPLPINGYLTGSWYDPAHSGEGILTQVFDVGDARTRVFALTWYTYDAMGLPFWIVGNTTFNIGATNISNMTMQYLSGGGFAGTFTPPLPRTNWGAISVSFPDCQHMSFGYNGNASAVNGPTGSGSRQWVRVGSINSLACQ